ncbi:Nuclease S1 [Gossypium australe]|uniref:Aspergillus nuclease S1 n=1 Tax=Gossypium australe TaxID=47621 RepID=A0A5B6X4K6_9ROSI|nr:Nuclease S1 [Gossypium australe]
MGFRRMGWHELLWVGRLLVLMQLLHGVFGWGKDGHFAVCKIAEEYLTKDALATVKELLPDSAGGELASVCSWADDVRWHYHWSSPLHYVDTPDFKCNYKYCRDCHDATGHKDSCVTGAIFNYTKQLFSAYQGYGPQLSCLCSSSGTSELKAVTCWLLRRFRWEYNYSPLVPQEDKSTPCELFSVQHPFLVWDTMIIDSAVKTLYGSDLATMIQAIQRNITDAWSNDVSSWENCGHNQTVCPNLYASESVRMACKFAYRNATPGSTLEDGNITATMPSKHMTGLLAFSPFSMTDSVPEFDEYFLSRLPIVEKRLAQGGIRLAAVLNRLFNSEVKIAQA